MKYLFLFSTLVLCSFFYSPQAHADSIANVNRSGQGYSSANNEATAKLNFEKGANGEVAVTSRKRKYIIPLSSFHLLNGDLWISEDGETVIWMLKSHFLSGNVKADADAIIVFKSGKQTYKIKLNELIMKFSELNHSVSHSNWILKIDIDFKKESINLTTTEYKVFEIDFAKNGVKDLGFLQEYKEAPAIVTGSFIKASDVERFSNSTVKFRVGRWIKGDSSDSELEVSGITTKTLPSGGPFIFKKNGKNWEFVSYFYDGIQTKTPISQMKFPAYFLPRVSVQMHSGQLKFKKLAQGEMGAVVIQFIPQKFTTVESITSTVVVIPDVSWNAKGESKINKYFIFDSAAKSWKDSVANSSIAVTHQTHPVDVDHLRVEIPSPGPQFTLYQEKNINIAENPIRMTSTATPTDIKDFFDKIQIKNIEVTSP